MEEKWAEAWVGDVDRRLGAWVGGMGRDPSDERPNELLETGVRDRSDETKVMSFRDEMRVNERERGKW